MKILLLNPHRDAMTAVVELFRSSGHAVLQPNDPEDAWQMLALHGASIDLAIVHREWGKQTGQDLGMKFIQRFRSDSVQADLPYVLTTEAWNESDCAQHQATSGPLGANAYLTWPFSADQLLDLVRQVIPETSTSIARPAKAADTPALAEPPAPTTPMATLGPSSQPPTPAKPPLFDLPSGSSTAEPSFASAPPVSPNFELSGVESAAAAGFTNPGTGSGLALAQDPPAFEFTHGVRPGSPNTPAPFELSTNSVAEGFAEPFSSAPEPLLGATSPMIQAPASARPIPPPFHGHTPGQTKAAEAPALSFPNSPIAHELIDPVSGPMVLEDAHSLMNKGDDSNAAIGESSISLVMPTAEDLSQFTERPPADAAPAGLPEASSATIAIGSGAIPGMPPAPSVNESTRHLSAVHAPPPVQQAGGTVTMMAPPRAPMAAAPPEPLGRDTFDEGVPTATWTSAQTPEAPRPGLAASIDLDSDKEVMEKMPYLFSGQAEASPDPGPLEKLGTRILPAMTGILKASPTPAAPKAPMHMDQAMGDAIVPGGAAQSPDADTLKKYLMLREQDVAVLSTQLKTLQDQLQATADQVRAERARSGELAHLVTEQSRRIEDFEREKTAALESLQSEIDDLRFQLKARNDKVKLVENRLRDTNEETERLKERVRSDIRKIRVHEKELENRLEILKKDSEALISARETKIIELKRKVDLLEFNMDLLQNQYAREKDVSAKLRERLAKAAQIVRVAGGLLDSEGKAALEQLTSIDSGHDRPNRDDKREAS